MAQYFANFQNNLPVYDNLNEVLSLDTQQFLDATQVIVGGQGIFTWFSSQNSVPDSLSPYFVFPTTYGYGWILNPHSFLVKDNGQVDLCNMVPYLSAYISPQIIESVTFTAKTQTVSITGVLPSDLIFLQSTSAADTGGAAVQPIQITPNTNSVTITLNITPTSSPTYKIFVFRNDLN